MATLANGIDFFLNGFKSMKGSTVDHAGMQSGMLLCYALTAFMLLEVMPTKWVFSYTLFIGTALQFLGYVALCFKARGTKSVNGLSSQSLVLVAVSHAARLTATSLYEGYLPVDSSGDLMYQLVDGCTLLCVLYLLYATHKTYVDSYQEECDTFPILPLVSTCGVLAYFFHGRLNRCELFDTIWAFSLNIETFQLVPQLYMMVKVGGFVDRATAHFVANTFLACVFRTAFWVWAIPGCKDLSSEAMGFSWNMEIGGVHILVCHAVELLILLDFMYHYVKAWRRGTAVELQTEGEL